jgi:DNA-binding beta-propeller fold protein YncE
LVYVIGSDVTAIKGATDATTTITPTFGSPWGLVVEPVGDKIYTAMASSLVVEAIDGGTNGVRNILNEVEAPAGIAVDSVTNDIFLLNNTPSSQGGWIGVQMIPNGSQQSIPLHSSITPLPGNRTTSSAPAFSLSAASGFDPVRPPVQGMYAQLDTWQAGWSAATNQGGGSFSVTVGPLLPGLHTLYVYAVDGQEAASAMSSAVFVSGSTGDPIVGDVAAYTFLVKP